MPALPELHFHWTWDLVSPPDALWPLVSNTDRFNRDCGYPPVQAVAPGSRSRSEVKPVTNARRLQARVRGVLVEWDELAFEWLAPVRYGVERNYFSGPVAKMVMYCTLAPRPGGGTRLDYDLRLTPAGLFGRLALPIAIGRKARATTERVFRRYDEFAQRHLRTSQLAAKPALAAGGAERLENICDSLISEARQSGPLVEKLKALLGESDDLSAARLRPYAVADEWGDDRRQTLKLFLHATRAGLLDFSWDVVCPHCRGAKTGPTSLAGLQAEAHCDSCNVDFTANFDQLVELTFRPNPAVRKVARVDYCVGGPQVTPHIVAQQRLRAGEERALPLSLEPGSYRVRVAGTAEHHPFRVDPLAAATLRVDLGAKAPTGEQTDAGWKPALRVAAGEPGVAPAGMLTLANPGGAEQLALVERIAWSDQAATAAEVTALQVFRDLFSHEVLRPGGQISVGAMTIVFTDLKNSTQLYQDIGDAPAFGRVLTHFEILRAIVAAEDGAIVKTMGDAVMAVFPRPVAALRAMAFAQRQLACPGEFPLPEGLNVPPSSLQPLALKAGIHSGPCLAINQNERLDYFGTTVNFTARLCSLCTGTDLILSSVARADAEVAAYLAARAAARPCALERVRLKGFGPETFEVFRIAPT